MMATWNAVLCLMALVDFLAFLTLIGVLFMYLVHIVAIFYGKVKLHKCNLSSTTACLSPNGYPGVTMLKPLVGEDENLYKNLKSCFDLSYHKLQILFCVEDEHDPAAKTVKKLMEDYPNVEAQLLTCATTGGVNPKINNMLQGYKVAKYDLLWINDSSLFVDPNTLMQMVSEMTANVGITHQVPFLVNNPTFSGVLQKVYFGTQHARVYLFANALGITCTNGMSMLLRKHVLDEVGGLQAFSSYIAEDFFISQSFADRGWKIVLSALPAMQNPARTELWSFFSRMVRSDIPTVCRKKQPVTVCRYDRWTRLRITMMPVIGVLEPLTECITIGLLGCWGLYHLRGSNIWLFLLCHCLIWFIADQLLLHTLQGPLPLQPFYQLALAWLLRETWTYVIFFRGICGREITWKNGAFRIQTGGKAYLIQGMRVENGEHCL